MPSDTSTITSIAETLRRLQTQANERNLTFLAYLISMAASQAEEHLRTQDADVPPSAHARAMTRWFSR